MRAHHILIVDDNATDRKLLAAVLEAEGYITREASEGTEGLKLLNTTKVDAVISDILMPNMDGYRFCYEVRKSRKYSTLPFIVHTAAYTSPSDERLAIELGADKILKKPVTSTEVLQTLREVLTNPLYQEPRVVSRPKRIKVIKEYRDALVSKLEEKTVELQNTTRELKASGELFRLITENVTDLIAVLDLTGKRLYNSPSYKAFFGDPETLRGTDSFQEIHPDERERIMEIFHKTVATGVGQRTEYRILLQDGSSRHVESQGSVVRDPEGKPAKVVVVSRDITERKWSEDQLRQTHGQLRHLLEHSPAVIYTLKIEGERVIPYVVSENIKHLLGFTVAESISFDWWAGQLHPEDRKEAFASIPKTIERGVLTCEYRLRHKDLHYIWVEDNRRLVRDAEGGPAEIVGVWTDITWRKEAEEKLQESVEQFRLIAENVADLIAVLDVDGKRLYNSPSYKDILGDPLDLLGTDSFGEIHPDDRERIRIVFSDTLRTGIGQRSEFRFLAKDGDVRHIESQGSTIRDEHGKVSKVLVVSRDVTEKKKLEAQFLRSQRMESIGTLAGGIAHDLNNVLAPIVMGIEMLKEMATDEGSQRILRTLETSARRGSGMVNQVLAFARGISGERVVLQAGHLIQEMQKIVRETFPKSIQIGTEVPRDLWSISADATQLHQVLLNLCVNGRDAMPNGGTLTITAKNTVLDENYAVMNQQARAGPYVLLTVTDTGTGIPADLLDKVFDPFFTTKEIGKGTGLGLSTVHTIAKNHGGFVNVYSEVGKGTRFCVYLPAETSAEEKRGEGEHVELPAGRGEFILLVDDEASIRDICRVTLESYGYNVLTASDGTEAIVQYTTRRNEIQLVITDMLMPIMDGRETIRALRKINPDVKIIATSGYMADEKLIDPRDPSICAFLAKPYTAATLLTTVSDALTKSMS